jgi:DNA-binding transcriptional ArsR family regulator
MDKKLVIFIKAISEPTRFKIINHLKKECCVGELWKRLNLSQNLTSHHLRILREAKLIIPKKKGLKVVYKLDEASLEINLEKLKNYLLNKL